MHIRALTILGAQLQAAIVTKLNHNSHTKITEELPHLNCEVKLQKIQTFTYPDSLNCISQQKKSDMIRNQTEKIPEAHFI